MKYDKKRIKAVVIVLVFLAAGLLYCGTRSQDIFFTRGSAASGQETIGQSSTTQGDDQVPQAGDSEPAGGDSSRHMAAEADADAVSEETEQVLIRVHVCGAVKKSGVYQLQEGALVQDAVRAAGGVRKDGAQDYLNLAGRLEDGQKVYVPFLKDVDDPYGLSAGSGGQDKVSSDDGSGRSGSATGQSGSATGQSGNGTGQAGDGTDFDPAGAGLVNINTADADLLMTLPGIGESKASAILTYREKNGAFSRIEDIMNVSGIKEGAFAKIEDLITV